MEKCDHPIRTIGPNIETMEMEMTCGKCNMKFIIINEIQRFDTEGYSIITGTAIEIKN